jgi:hypothetical protein
MKNFSIKLSLLTIGLCIVSPVWAMPVTVTHVDIPNCCDFLSVPTNLDEVGINIFPPNETITSSDQLATTIACPSQANPATVATQVSITNQTGRSYTNLWYVADPETTLTNVDGLVNNEHAFKIDTAGINVPLIFESTNINGVFEPGETWDFLIDGYFNTFGLPASAFMSIGVGTFSVGDQKSSGSIIGTPVPEPTSCMLVACSLTGFLFRRR